MKVKAIDIARKLNISKATVSLALNDKPGVSEKTKKKILECMEELQGKKEERPEIAKTIQIIMYNNDLRVMQNVEMDLWTEVFRVFDQEAKKKGYSLGLLYVRPDEKELDQAVRNMNDDSVAGVILVATEMRPDQFEPFRNIKKPMIIYDNDLSNEYHCVTTDGVNIIREAVDYLVSRGCREIRYLGNKVSIYNFSQRRAGYRAGLRKNRLELKEDSIVLIGEQVNDVYENMKRYLESHKLPDAFIMENYQVSLGVMRALRDAHISVPRDVSLVGVDELSEYFTGDFLLTTVKVEHADRARAVMMFLEQEMDGTLPGKFKVYSNCKLIHGNSVK